MSGVIAERTLGCVYLGAKVEGAIRFQAPQPDQNDWRCDYSVALPDLDRRAHAMGVDSFQALHLAMQAAVAEIARSETFKSGRLEIFGEPIVTLADLKQAFGFSSILGINA